MLDGAVLIQMKSDPNGSGLNAGRDALSPIQMDGKSTGAGV
jgi:hypothetical protein